jgi:DNA-binding NarL/FixJ family response regulator
VLTLDPPATTPMTELRLDLSSSVVRLALRYVTEDSGWHLCGSHMEGCPCLLVADRAIEGVRTDVLVVRDDAARCQDGLDAILDGRARALVLWDEPETLISAVDLLQRGASYVPERVLRLAQGAPRLTPRQRRTLRLLSAGRSNREIAVGLHQSQSTTKRDIAELLEIFDVANRASLMTCANRLGFL